MSRSAEEERDDMSRKELRREDAESLPDREGTLDNLRNEASKHQEGAIGSKDAPEEATTDQSSKEEVKNA